MKTGEAKAKGPCRWIALACVMALAVFDCALAQTGTYALPTAGSTKIVTGDRQLYFRASLSSPEASSIAFPLAPSAADYALVPQTKRLPSVVDSVPNGIVPVPGLSAQEAEYPAISRSKLMDVTWPSPRQAMTRPSVAQQVLGPPRRLPDIASESAPPIESLPGQWQVHADQGAPDASEQGVWIEPGLPGAGLGGSTEPAGVGDDFSLSGREWPWVLRLGWWESSFDGSPTKIGEYQSLKSSIFYDLDRLWSNGFRTLDVSLTGLDEDGQQASLFYYGPRLWANVDYQRFFRRLDRDPLSAFVDFDQQPPDPLPPAPANFRDMKEDRTVGEDFAIRVQELDAGFKGKLTKNIDWRVNVWGMRKHGERQVVAFGHCFTAPNATDTNGVPVSGVACHVLSQRQRIDWLTMEVEPAVSTQVGPVALEYSRTMRSLATDDQLTTRPYDNFGFNGDFPVAVVPENFTQIDRLKLGWRLPNRRDVYGRFFIGTTDNQYRDTVRRFRGSDVRFTDRSAHGFRWTAYANQYIQKGTRPASLLPQESFASIRTPIGYDRQRLGLRGRWRPAGGVGIWQRRLSLSAGYEYGELRRSNAVFVEQALTADESRTVTNIARMRASLRWSPQFDTYVGYRVGVISDPLYGVPIRNTATNTKLPTETHLVDLGATWAPSNDYLLSLSLSLDNSGNFSDIATFGDDDLNIVLTGWHSPTERWSVSGGLAFYRTWIDQDITLGSKSTPLTQPWFFVGQTDMVNIGTTYRWTRSVTLTGGYEFLRSTNIATAPSPYADIPPLSNAVIEISRLSLGFDYQLQRGLGCYFRYQFFDYEDKSQALNSGTSDLLLFGADAVY